MSNNGVGIGPVSSKGDSVSKRRRGPYRKWTAQITQDVSRLECEQQEVSVYLKNEMYTLNQIVNLVLLFLVLLSVKIQLGHISPAGGVILLVGKLCHPILSKREVQGASVS